jgi:hypothetical protein
MFPNPIGSKIELHGAASMKAIDEEKAFYSTFDGTFTVLAEKPLNWNSAWDSYYVKADGWYKKLQKANNTAGVLEFTPYTYYKLTTD